MYDFCVFLELGNDAGNSVVESNTESDDQVGVVNGVVGGGEAVHAEHSEGKWVRGGSASDSVEGPGGGDLCFFEESMQFVGGVGESDSVPKDDDGAFG